MHVVFDLDGTVIDSRHRHATLADGSLDLAHWKKNSTPEMIAKDTLLPLARCIRAMRQAGHTIVICTARVFTEADMDYLQTHELVFDTIFTRDGETDMRPDAKLKVDKLSRYCELEDIAMHDLIMFDDNLSVIHALAVRGVTMINATNENRRLAA